MRSTWRSLIFSTFRSNCPRGTGMSPWNSTATLMFLLFSEHMGGPVHVCKLVPSHRNWVALVAYPPALVLNNEPAFVFQKSFTFQWLNPAVIRSKVRGRLTQNPKDISSSGELLEQLPVSEELDSLHMWSSGVGGNHDWRKSTLLGRISFLTTSRTYKSYVA